MQTKKHNSIDDNIGTTATSHRPPDILSFYLFYEPK